MKKTINNGLKNWSWVGYFVLGVLVGTTLLGAIVYGSYRIIYAGKVFPHIWLGEQKVSGMSRSEALSLLANESDRYLVQNPAITFSYQGQKWNLQLTEIGVSYDAQETLNNLVSLGRQGRVDQQLSDQWNLFRQGKAVRLATYLNEDELKVFVASVAAEINIPAIPTTIELVDQVDSEIDSRIVIKKGEEGYVVDEKEAVSKTKEMLSLLGTDPINLEVVEQAEEISEDQLMAWKRRAESLVDKELELVFDNKVERTRISWVLKDKDMIGLLSPTEEFDERKIKEYMANIGQVVERPAQDALFQFNADIGRVVEFQPAKDGLELDIDKAIADLKTAIIGLESEELIEAVMLSAQRVSPKITNEEVNRLGIKELIGRGESTFYGSIASRIHNIKLAASRLNGLLVAPGETFSYNAALGDVSTATGFQTAYIIQDGRTVLGDGGGVCQDSTTLFRAVMNAGLPVVERRAHAYRVGYYEQNEKAGFDATVFAPTTDFKFSNDTPAHILIQAYVEGSKLVIEFYGTNDGRIATISNYKMWDVSPPPPDLYQDDPTLPAGTEKQVDWKAWGAKTKFDYEVTRNGEVIHTKTFYSSFKPWQSVFLRGTGGV